MMKSPRDIVWVGPVYVNGGYGQVSRSFALEMLRQGVSVRIVPLGASSPSDADFAPDEARALQAAEHTAVSPDATVIMHSDPGSFPLAQRVRGGRTVGYTIAETDRIPPEWSSLCNAMDQVWIPTCFNEATFTRFGVEQEKVRVLPYGIDVDRLDRLAGEAPAKEADEFVFLYVCAFDFRKGVDLLIEAYLREFRRGEPVRLRLKTWAPGYSGLRGTVTEWAHHEFGGRLQSGPPVEIVERYTDAREMVELYRDCSLYISTDRANGWGMPCMEAMALGKPAATIDWSGSTEFMTAENSVLIRPTGELEPVDVRLSSSRPELYAGHRWARVEVEEVQRAMRWAYEHPEELRRIGQAARKTMKEQFSIETATRHLVAEACST